MHIALDERREAGLVTGQAFNDGCNLGQSLNLEQEGRVTGRMPSETAW